MRGTEVVDRHVEHLGGLFVRQVPGLDVRGDRKLATLKVRSSRSIPKCFPEPSSIVKIQAIGCLDVRWIPTFAERHLRYAR